MQNFRDYYEILGISKEAAADEIKRAYRALARKYHPDLNPGDKDAEEKFKLIGEAYDVLSDADKKSQYEEYSRYWNQKGFLDNNRSSNRSSNRRKRGSRASKAEAEYSDFEDFDNFVEQLLKRHQAGEPEIWQAPPEPAVRTRTASTTERINPEQRDRAKSPPSSRNSQSSAARRYKAQPIAPSRRDAEADLTVPLEKAYAGGRERVRLEDGRSLEVNMPPGMVTGQRIRLKGQGIDGGNLYLRIEVKPHDYFTLQEGDVYCQLPITPSEAVLGGTIAVPTLSGRISMMIPPGVQSGQRLRLSGKGYPVGQGLYGDQILEIEVVIPKVLDDEEKALYQELRNIERFNPRADLPV